MRNFLSELRMKQREFLLHCDNKSAIHLAKNSAYHSQTKHIQRRYHWLREKVDDGEFTLMKSHTDDNGSDMLTKNLPIDRLRVYRQRTGLPDSFPQEWRGRLRVCWQRTRLADSFPQEWRGRLRVYWQRTGLADSFPQEWRGSLWEICPSCGKSRLFGWGGADSRRQGRVEVRTKSIDSISDEVKCQTDCSIRLWPNNQIDIDSENSQIGRIQLRGIFANRVNVSLRATFVNRPILCMSILLGNRSLRMGTDKPAEENWTGWIRKETDRIRWKLETGTYL